MYLDLDVPRVLLRRDAAPRLLPAGEVPRSSSETSGESCLGCMGKGWDVSGGGDVSVSVGANAGGDAAGRVLYTFRQRPECRAGGGLGPDFGAAPPLHFYREISEDPTKATFPGHRMSQGRRECSDSRLWLWTQPDSPDCARRRPGPHAGRARTEAVPRASGTFHPSENSL